MEKVVKIEAFIPDKSGNISRVLEAMDGIALQVSILPVRNAKTNGGKLVETGQPTTAVECVRQEILKAASQGLPEITTDTLNASGQTYGFSRAAIMGAITAMKKQKVLRIKVRGTYEILNQLTE